MATDQTVTLTWDTRTPSGQPATILSLADHVTTVSTGTDIIWLDRGIIKNPVEGKYTFTGSMVYKDRETSDSSTFTVSGTSIPIGLAQALTCKDVDDTHCIDITDDFTTSDWKVVVWTAWEGAWGSHIATYEWYLPNGTFWFRYSQPFNSGSALYKTWCYFEGGLWQTGTYTVVIKLDNTQVSYVKFKVTTSGQLTEMQKGPIAVGGGGQE